MYFFVIYIVFYYYVRLCLFISVTSIIFVRLMYIFLANKKKTLTSFNKAKNLLRLFNLELRQEKPDCGRLRIEGNLIMPS